MGGGGVGSIEPLDDFTWKSVHVSKTLFFLAHYDSSSLDAITSLTFLCYSWLSIRLAWKIPSKVPSMVHSLGIHSSGYRFKFKKQECSVSESVQRTS